MGWPAKPYHLDPGVACGSQTGPWCLLHAVCRTGLWHMLHAGSLHAKPGPIPDQAHTLAPCTVSSAQGLSGTQPKLAPHAVGLGTCYMQWG